MVLAALDSEMIINLKTSQLEAIMVGHQEEIMVGQEQLQHFCHLAHQIKTQWN